MARQIARFALPRFLFALVGTCQVGDNSGTGRPVAGLREEKTYGEKVESDRLPIPRRSHRAALDPMLVRRDERGPF